MNIGSHPIGTATYFIADIASNHNGDLNTAKDLVWLAKEAGADAVKFQHFLAPQIVSDYGFRHLGGQASHQAKWKKGIYETFRDAEFNREWNGILAEEARKARVDFLSTPYDREAVDSLDPLVPAFKIGSGDITWLEFVEYIARKGKPVLLATGASEMWEVEQAVDAILRHNPDVVLMQCNTNYTGDPENFRCANLNVLKTYAARYPGMVLGLSDHTPGHSAVLGAIALGARVVEKHFTADTRQEGPDHAFSMTPVTWREMVDRSRELEAALGDGVKRVEANERETVVLQRRCVRARVDIPSGTTLTADMLEELRPAPADSVFPYDKAKIIGRKTTVPKERGDCFRFAEVE